MTRLFIRFYLGVLIVLFLAWYIHGAVLKRRADEELARVMKEAHGGGARLVASELDAAPPEIRSQLLKSLRGRFDYPIDVIALVDLPGSLQRQISSGDDVAYYRAEENQHFVVAALSSGSEHGHDCQRLWYAGSAQAGAAERRHRQAVGGDLRRQERAYEEELRPAAESASRSAS